MGPGVSSRGRTVKAISGITQPTSSWPVPLDRRQYFATSQAWRSHLLPAMPSNGASSLCRLPKSHGKSLGMQGRARTTTLRVARTRHILPTAQVPHSSGAQVRLSHPWALQGVKSLPGGWEHVDCPVNVTGSSVSVSTVARGGGAIHLRTFHQ